MCNVSGLSTTIIAALGTHLALVPLFMSITLHARINCELGRRKVGVPIDHLVLDVTR